MEKSLEQQTWEIKDVIRRAKANPDKSGAFVSVNKYNARPFCSHIHSQRRETLRRLIELTRSSQPSLRILAAGGLQHFFKYFPDLEEASINAVYDLCEDQDPEVRRRRSINQPHSLRLTSLSGAKGRLFCHHPGLKGTD
jgi:Apoptosis inhibitory protein 5 (API5)